MSVPLSIESVDIAAEAIRYAAIQKVSELAGACALLLEQRPRVIVEVGSFRGGTLRAWARCAMPDALIVTVDSHEYPTGNTRYLKELALGSQRVEQIIGDSTDPETIKRVWGFLDERGERADYLFIDGDHRLEVVSADHRNYAPMVRPGGLVGFHDITARHTSPAPEHQIDVPELWPKVRGDRYWEFVSVLDEEHWGGIGIYET